MTIAISTHMNIRKCSTTDRNLLLFLQSVQPRGCTMYLTQHRDLYISCVKEKEDKREETSVTASFPTKLFIVPVWLDAKPTIDTAPALAWKKLADVHGVSESPVILSAKRTSFSPSLLVEICTQGTFHNQYPLESMLADMANTGREIYNLLANFAPAACEANLSIIVTSSNCLWGFWVNFGNKQPNQFLSLSAVPHTNSGGGVTVTIQTPRNIFDLTLQETQKKLEVSCPPDLGHPQKAQDILQLSIILSKWLNDNRFSLAKHLRLYKESSRAE